MLNMGMFRPYFQQLDLAEKYGKGQKFELIWLLFLMLIIGFKALGF
jgi:hypothetical protein